MRSIRLQDFRCYTKQEIKFKPGMNLLVGDNASGKTSVLRACRYVMGAFFAGFSDEHTKWVTLDATDFRQVVNDGILLPEQPVYIHFDAGDTMEHAGQLMPTMDSFDSFTLMKASKKNSRSLLTGIKEYRDYAAALQRNYLLEGGKPLSLPLFAAFTTEDIHAKRKIDRSKFMKYNHKPSFGYYECLNGAGFLPYWILRLRVLREAREDHPEVGIVIQALRDALGAQGCNVIDDVDIRHVKSAVYFRLNDGREVEAELLSDGYRRLVSMVMDIAFRCALLNRGVYGHEACSRTLGTVLIDEVDLHLHPSLQSVVLKGLRNAFPRLQFIVSSHAPMLMSGVKNNEHDQVYKLDFEPGAGYTVAPVDTYGLGLSTLTDVVLDQTPRVAEVAVRGFEKICAQ